jgi:uncharacterized membrane protein
MLLKICEFISISITALATGMFFGPWLALSRSMKAFKPEVFLSIVDRLNKNMAPIMTLLIPMAMLSMIPVMVISYGVSPETFYMTLTSIILFIVALIVTMRIEVPIVKQIVTWTVSTLPDNWQQLRDRWGTFHIVRVLTSFIALILLVAGAIF